MSFSVAALGYGKQGYSVIPIKPKGKEPLVLWKEYQTRRASEEEIREWWGQNAEANVGIVTGSISGVVVIDIDSPEGLKELEKRSPDYDFKVVPRSSTGEGSHLFFKHPGTSVPNRTNILPGVDVDIDFRGDGGQVVVPPSIHPNGKQYKWEVPLTPDLPELPPELLKLITSSGLKGAAKYKHERFDTAKALVGVPESQRNDTLFRLACKLRSADVPQDSAAELVMRTAKNCKPPYPSNPNEEDPLAIVARVYETYPAGKGTKLKAGSDNKKLPGDLVGRRIHPAIHIESDFQSIGIVTREDTKDVFKIITSSGDSHLADDIKDALLVKPVVYPCLSGRWPQSLDGPNLSDSVAFLIQKLRELVWFEDQRWHLVIALWSAGTYLFPAFATYPYLQITGEKGSGKTKIQDLLECTAFNALKVVDPSPAVLFRIIQALRPTLLIDEVESMNAEEAKEIRGIINAGYKRGASVPRVEGEDRHISFFEVYSPKCLAGIQGLGSVTEDRCITIVMGKPPQDDPRQDIVVDPLKPEWSTIRRGFYRLPFSYGKQLLLGGHKIPLPAWLKARDRELWSPLLQIAHLVDNESNLGIVQDVLGLAKEAVREKGLTFEAEAVLGLLESKLDGEDVLNIHPVELAGELEVSLNRKHVSPEWVAGRLRSLGIKKIGRDREGVIYQVRVEKLLDVRRRYSPPEQPTHLHTQQPTQPEATENKGEY